MSIGIGLFGLFYGLRAAYQDGANILQNFYSTWGAEGVRNAYGAKMVYEMPEWADKFQSTAGTYTFMVALSSIVTLVGIYMVYKKLHED